ncbi:cytochrome P450 [Planobispora longispora]|uniref:Cytochrome P450 n=1 Tax=Planobispora longispora TaxID=28887 RepID=A0A8J3RG29_9ACTN|nr:cytochrome P450 [Planobispora longispora]GIH73596.1 cytochrome P450 [Planobispora longispora]
MTATFPFGPVSAAEGMEIIRALHADRPMTRVSFEYGGDAWVIHGYEACRQMLEDRRFVRKPFHDGRVVPYAIEFPEFLTKTLQFMDPPDHTRLRRLVAKAFTMRRVEKLRPSTEALAHRLIDEMTAGRASANLVEAYALPLPIQVIGDLLGVPPEGRTDFVKWSHALLSTSGMAEETVIEHAASLFMYLSELITARRSQPQDDLLSALAAAQEADDRLTDGEIVEIAMLLVLGGFDNTANFMEQGVMSLLLNPEHRAYLAEDVEARIGPAVEEILRHAGMEMGKEVEGRVGLVPFAAAEDVELAGVMIKQGEAVMVDLGSANHDDRAFDDPGRFDLARKHNPHLTFSHGLHRCIGAALATMELQVGIGVLLKRLPGLALAGDPVYLEGVLTGGMTELPVTW